MTDTPQPPVENPLQKELLIFKELFERLINALLNWLFDLRPEKAVRRMQYLLILFLLTGALVTLYSYPLILWAQRLQEIFLYLLNPNYATAYAATYGGEPFSKLFDLLRRALADPHILQYFPIFLAPIFIALHLAALYLADIFELEDVAVARSFVWAVALSGSNETIRISQGNIADQNSESPNYLIGGPGKVIVDLDSVALFERADGTPHVIGPTGKEPYGKATIDGFERFRQAIDIRDHYVELRDQDSKSPSVVSRSRDGIPITATDVRLMFSVYRGENAQLSPESPYPFSREAIERIVYKSGSKVTPDQTNPSAYEFSWINNMIGLIRSRLSDFMSERNLTEYLASTGAPEFEKLKQREELIAEQIRRLTKPIEEDSQAKPIKPPPDFTPRYKITDLFSQFTEGFTKNAHDKGVELHWIGVGTWKTPPDIEIVSEKHLEAWKISQENMKAGSPEAMSRAESEAILGKLEALIRGVPIEAYQNIVGSNKQFNKRPMNRKQDHKSKDRDFDEDAFLDDEDMVELLSENLMISDLTKRFNDRITAAAEQKMRDSDQRDEMRTLLLEYRKELTEAVQFMKAKDEPVPPIIEEAIKYIDTQMGFKHWAGN